LIYEPDALSFTGISMEMLNKGIDFKTFSKEFPAFLKKSNPHSHPKYRTIIAGHNVTFDVPFLQQLMFFMGKKIEDYFNSYVDYYGNQQPKVFDTLQLTMIKWPEMLKHTLADGINKAGFELVQAHRAMNDVKANVELLKVFIKSLKNEGMTMADVISEERPFREIFKF